MSSIKQSSEVRVWIMPPTLYLVSVLVGVGLHFLLPLASWMSFVTAGVGLTIVAAGIGLAVWGEQEFKRHTTPVNPNDTPTALVTSGPYKFTRNPMYVGLTMFQLGIGVALGSTAVLLMLIPTLLVMHFGVILREEAYMRQAFGRAYVEYYGRVRRWL